MLPTTLDYLFPMCGILRSRRKSLIQKGLSRLPTALAEPINRTAASDDDAPLRGLANLVGGFKAGPLVVDTPLTEFEAMFALNLRPTFLVTQAQRDLLQAQVNLLQTTLDYESSLVNFEAVQQAPPLAAGESVVVSGASVVRVPTPAPRGLFRPGSGGGLP